MTDSYDFRAYGETFASSGSTVNVFRWVGELGYYFDIDRLAYYLRARPYSPKLARFLSIDPTRPKDDVNFYTYALGSPIRLFDPSGFVSINSLADCVGYFVNAGITFPISIPGLFCWGTIAIDYFKNRNRTWDHDKWAHCMISCQSAKVYSGPPIIFGGIAKEFLDCLIPGWSPDNDDIRANLRGIECAGPESFIPIIGPIFGLPFRESCEDYCSGTYPKWKGPPPAKPIPSPPPPFREETRWICFVAGTPVRLDNNRTKAIEELRPGDIVATYDLQQAIPSRGDIVEVFQRPIRGIITLGIGEEEVTTTSEHPFYVVSRGWTPARELQLGDALFSFSGKSVVIHSITPKDTLVSVYNISVSGHQNYFVGTGGYVVHNKYQKEPC